MMLTQDASGRQQHLGQQVLRLRSLHVLLLMDEYEPEIRHGDQGRGVFWTERAPTDLEHLSSDGLGLGILRLLSIDQSQTLHDRERRRMLRAQRTAACCQRLTQQRLGLLRRTSLQIRHAKIRHR
jgi:hypothetical protein